MSGPRRESWAVVGGGILGMTVAHRLARAGRAVTLFEAEAEPGGLTASGDLGGVTWDRFYHVILLSDRHTRGLLAELGLDDALEWVTTRTGLFAEGRLHSVSTTLELLRMPVLSPIDKARLGATVLAASRMTDWRSLERERVEDWLVRWSGRPAFQRFWLPLLRSKLGEGWRDTSAMFLWATIRRLYAARRTGLKREMFGYVDGGYRRIIGRFREVLAAADVQFQTGRPVRSVSARKAGAAGGAGVEVVAQGLPPRRFDRVVVTAPMPAALAMCRGLSDDERRRMEGVRYLGVICPSVVLSRPLGGYYVTNLLDGTLPFTGIIEMSALVDPQRLGGRHLVYLPRYAAPDDPMFDAPDDEVRDRFLDGLRRVHPDLLPEHVVGARVARARCVMALPTLRRSESLPRVHTSVPGVYVLNGAHILAGTLNVDETVRLAGRGLAAIFEGREPTEEG